MTKAAHCAAFAFFSVDPNCFFRIFLELSAPRTDGILSACRHLNHLHSEIIQIDQFCEICVYVSVLHVLDSLLLHCEVFVFKLVHCIRFLCY
jgi:hypothetical protein